MIAYHFPPLQGSSGIQRTLRFAQHLPQFGWQPIILTANTKAYENVNSAQLSEVIDQVSVYRSFALDTARHLSILKRYPRILAVPDRWITWWLGSIPKGLYLIRTLKPDVIWSTFPIATAHLIGYTLSRITGLPWVTDFRDPMVQPDYPPNPLVYRSYQWIEQQAIRYSAHTIVTTPGTKKDYIQRFPTIPESRFRLIENGYDELSFSGVLPQQRAQQGKQLILIHSGIIYSSERDPTIFFEALSDLLREKRVSSDSLKIILRATYNDNYLQQLIKRYEIESIVSLAPPISYKEAIAEMLSADGLLILQASNCNNQIPAKLYEYLRAQKPILALTDPEGDTALKLKSLGINTIARLDSKLEIIEMLQTYLESIQKKFTQDIPIDQLYLNSREARTVELVHVLDEVVKK
ncbi:MAG: glycosyltransferase [Nitrosomonas sp.]|nr:glycosyltransferase [Nitrosomonas sp.]